ncbi:DNA-binding transcriptional MocR family regulator [Asanoa ferruginea]|uniref:DNA-binding transcriptional MocR family regulator n=1 Tax=Asanoa ferruginea TaxID=53367 RepID=A0A3D9ZKM1_9ACTN|nr:aminotransferase class I/II-fold pyridoxal phosphate-dependent enzyme [Asanoa ferruginea]REF97966.1 DNA-binding transcriptional MocR family regulator [Asanoa ferruginea]GIF50008.1 GntR family transcriptional regulator [Asanoa ferruginea]
MAVHYQIVGATAAEISTSIETGVRTGALAPGTPLPPVRGLADGLGVSAGTVAKAYQTLRSRGVIETAGRNGTRVRPRPPVTGGRAALVVPPPTGVLDLLSGEPDLRLLPPLGPHLQRLAEADPVGYNHDGMHPDLAESAAARLAADGVDAAHVTVTSGALGGIDRLLAAHLRPGDKVAVEDPGWAHVIDLVAAQGLEIVGVPVDDEGPTPSGTDLALAAGVQAFIVTSRAHNPTGAAVSKRRAADLRRVLADHPDVLLIEDDHSAELSTVPLHTLAKATRNWAFLRSVSKPYGPDLRLAVMAGDEATIARVAGRMRLGSGWVSTLLQRMVADLWSDPEVADRVALARDSYEHRRTALRKALDARGVPSQGRTGINIWVPVRDETSVVTSLRDAGYAVGPGSLYRIGAPAGIRITISRLDDDRIEALAAAVAQVVRGTPPRSFSA